MASEVIAPQQNFHLMYSGNTQPKKRGFPKANRDTPTPINTKTPGTSAPMFSYAPKSKSPSRAVALQNQRSHHSKDIPGRPLSSPPRETCVSCAAPTGLDFTKAEAEAEEPQSPPPIGEIRIPTQPNFYMSFSSPSCSASLPTSTNHSTTDYESLYFSTVRENHRLKQRLVFASEENRSLKRHLIELQRRLFTAGRNNRGRRREEPPTTATTVNDDLGGVQGWSVPLSSHKRIKRDDSFTRSPKVPQSVSSEETVVLEG